RLLLIAVSASFYEPVSRFVYSLTNRVITPLRPYIPRWRKIELASLLVAFVLALVERLVYALLFGAPAAVGFLLVIAFVRVLEVLIWIELIAIIARCVLSFVVQDPYNSNMQLLYQFTEPLVRPIRRVVPVIAGLDLSCWLASIALILAQLLIIAPLTDFALSLR
ncbi:MAG TPA: YggT family protein, partial [Rudaea sp.]